MSSARWTDALRSLASLAVIGVITAFQDLTRVANSLTVALTYLLVVLAVAAGWGLVPATCAAIAATLCLNYFSIPPIGTLTVADTQNWVALVVFLVVGIVASRLSERVRQQARQAEESRLETERLYALSRMILMRGGDPPQVAREAAAQIAQVFNVGGVQLYDYIGDQIFQAGPDEVAVSRDKLKEVAATRAASRIDEPGIAVVPLSLGGKAIGSIALVAAELSDAALQAIANLVSTALESARNQELARRAEIIRQSEQFKSTLLDALAHQLKTP